MIQRKYANMPGWKRILQHRYISCYLDTPEFRGHIALYCMDAVAAPLRVDYFQRKTCIVDAGYSWLRQYPADERHFIVTAQYDADSQIIAWYIDICLQTGLGQDQIPWMDDLYLDVVVSPSMEVELKDADELLAARESGDITAAEFDLAWREADRLMERIAKRQFGLLALTGAQREMLLRR